MARLLQTYVIPFELSATRKLGQCVLRRIISRTDTNAGFFQESRHRFSSNRDIERWKSFAVDAGDFAHSDILQPKRRGSPVPGRRVTAHAPARTEGC